MNRSKNTSFADCLSAAADASLAPGRQGSKLARRCHVKGAPGMRKSLAGASLTRTKSVATNSGSLGFGNAVDVSGDLDNCCPGWARLITGDLYAVGQVGHPQSPSINNPICLFASELCGRHSGRRERPAARLPRRLPVLSAQRIPHLGPLARLSGPLHERQPRRVLQRLGQQPD
jgi:hypothetical protein